MKNNAISLCAELSFLIETHI